MRRIVFAALAALLLLSLPAPPARATVGELTGVVRNVENREPVTGAVVRVGSAVALTRESGDYRIPLPMAGRFVVRVESGAYHDAEKTILVEAGAYDLNFDLAPRRAASRVFGTVYDAILLRPVARAEVTLDGVAIRASAEGQFVFDPVEAGDRWLSVASPGYKVSAKRIRVDASAEQVDVYLVPDVEFARVAGTVRDRATSRPVPLAVVRVADARAVTGADGRFALPDAMPGEKRLTVSADGYFKYDDRIDVKSGATALDVYLEPRNVAELLDAMRRRTRDVEQVGAPDPPARIDAVTEGYPGPEGRTLLAGMMAQPLEERRGRMEKILAHETARPGETFVKIRVLLGEERADAGFIAFLSHGPTQTVRNVSLRAESNPHGVLLTKAVHRFTREADGLLLHLSVDGWSGTAPVRASGRVAEFEVTLYRASDALVGPAGALVYPPDPPAGYDKK